MHNDIEGKTAIVTGGTNGIGLITARELARMGAQVVIISRNPEKCQAAVSNIARETGSAHTEFIAADLSVMANVRRAAYDFKNRHSRLDILVNNAGAIFFKRLVSQDGFEMTFALNHLSYFLLTDLLLDTLISSAPARIVNVSSDAHQGGKIDFDDLMLKKKYSAFSAYSASKLANILFTYQLAENFKGTQVTVNALHPGFVSTGFAKNNGGLFKLGMAITNIFARKPEKGAETSIYLASSSEIEGVTGKYFSDSKEIKSSDASYDLATQKLLWEESLKLVAST